MFNIKYNFLVLIQLLLNAVNALLLIKVFGVSGQVDSYLLAASIISTMQLIQLVFFEQFLVFYTDIKSKSQSESNNFYNATLFLSFILGVVSISVLYIFKSLIFKIFVFNIDAQRLEYLNAISIVLFLSLIFIPISSLNEKLLNAERKFSIPYILTCLPTLFIVIAQLTIYFLSSNKIIYLAYGQVIGLALSAIIGTIFITKKIVPFEFVFYHPDIKPLIKNSFTTRLGDNIYNMLLPVFLNNILVTMSAGTVSCFYYAKKIIDTLKQLTIGPAVKIFRTNLTNFWVTYDIEKIRKDMKKFLTGSTLLMLSGIILSFLILPTALKIISMGKLSENDLHSINYIFLSLCPWYLVVIIEAPYILAIYTAKKSKIAIFANTLFIITFITLASILKDRIGIYAISAAGLFAQIFNFIIYKNYTEKLLKNLDKPADIIIKTNDLVEAQ